MEQAKLCQISIPASEDYKYKASGTVVRATILNNETLNFEIETNHHERKLSVSHEVVSQAMTFAGCSRRS